MQRTPYSQPYQQRSVASLQAWRQITPSNQRSGGTVPVSEYRLTRYRGKYAGLRYVNGKRERPSLGTTDKLEAQRLIDRLNQQIEKRQGHTVKELWQAYCEENKHKRIVEQMQYTFKALQETFADLDPQSIHLSKSRNYITMRRDMGRMDNTIWTELSHLRTVLSWAVKRGRIDRAFYIERPAKPAAKDRWLTREEVTRLKNCAINPHTRLFILLAIATGGRKEALLELTWDRVDFEQNTIHLATSGSTGRKGRASVPMNQTIKASLVESKRGALTDHVIEWSGKPLSSVKRSLATTAKRAGIKGVTAHVFRHSAAVWMASEGISMAMIAQYLGHSNSRITEQVYARFAPSHMQAAADVLNLDTGSIEPVPNILIKKNHR